jgi:uncharacterized membrane protein HdeD (DUF308 family)
MGTFMEVPSEETVRGRWKWFVALGVFLVVVGLIALWNVVDATLVTTIIVGVMLLFGGATQIVGALMSGGSAGRRIVMGLLGVLYIIVGFELIADPLAGAVALTIVVAIFLIVDGVLRLFSTLSHETEHRLLTGTLGVVNILLGIWLWSGIPFSGIAIGFFVGLQLLIAGFMWIGLGFMSRSPSEPTATAQAAG